MGVVLVIGSAVLITNILVDITYARADPRVHLGRAS
jgi:ABC-type dipeptide/oligopeptide/nickel transport system permease component